MGLAAAHQLEDQERNIPVSKWEAQECWHNPVHETPRITRARNRGIDYRPVAAWKDPDCNSRELTKLLHLRTGNCYTCAHTGPVLFFSSLLLVVNRHGTNRTSGRICCALDRRSVAVDLARSSRTAWWLAALPLSESRRVLCCYPGER
jgi:hypothetical protein